MIEVEKKFQPTEEQLRRLLADSQFIKEKNLHDIFYDYPDYRMMKDKVFLRSRNGKFELKIYEKNISGVAQETENEEDIKKYFKTDLALPEFITNHLVISREWKSKRIEYKKDEFIIDIDKLDFGFECVEIELIVKESTEAEEAANKILELAKSYGWEVKDVSAKREEYFRIVKPAVYNELYGKTG